MKGKLWMAVPLLGNGLIMALWAQLFFLPIGTSIRPMGRAAFTFVIAFATGVTGLGFSLVLFGRRRRAQALLCLLASLAPLPLAVLLVRLAMASRGIVLAD